jgi:hypothetical protein
VLLAGFGRASDGRNVEGLHVREGFDTGGLCMFFFFEI